MPPSSQASARILLTHRDGDDPQRAMANDAGMAITHSVAQRAINRLKLDGDAGRPAEALHRRCR